jgi:hypothetical protein
MTSFPRRRESRVLKSLRINKDWMPVFASMTNDDPVSQGEGKFLSISTCFPSPLAGAGGVRGNIAIFPSSLLCGKDEREA